MKRLSSYSILSTRLNEGGFVLLNGLSGAIDVISDEFAQILINKIRTDDHRQIYLEDDLIPVEIESVFIERGHITVSSHEKEQQQVVEFSDRLHEYESKQKQIVIVPSIDCNYRCVYCFEKPLQNRLNDYTEDTMNKAKIEELYSAIDKIKEMDYKINSSIFLYGGEPLNAENKEIVYEIVNKGTEVGFTFNAITNGHDLNEFLPILDKNKISHIQVTIDGPKEIHDKRRISRDGTSSYDKIISNIRRVIKETDTIIEIRINIDEENIDGFIELIDVFNNEKWFDTNRINIHAALVYKKNKKGEVITESSTNNISSLLNPIIDKCPNIKINHADSSQEDSIISALVKNTPYKLRTNYCGATSGMYIFLPDGNINCCWDSIGNDCSRIGHYGMGENLKLDEKANNYWFKRTSDKISECINCQYCLICSGGCPQYAQYNSGSIYKPFCSNFQKTFPKILANAIDRYLTQFKAAN